MFPSSSIRINAYNYTNSGISDSAISTFIIVSVIQGHLYTNSWNITKEASWGWGLFVSVMPGACLHGDHIDWNRGFN